MNNSNTTNVKVKQKLVNAHLHKTQNIQIQPMLRLNIAGTTNIPVSIAEFKYNQC